MFRLYRNPGPSCCRIQGWFYSCSAFVKPESKDVDKNKDHIKRKGGRPRKAVKKDQLLGVRCTKKDRFIIESKAKGVDLSVSEYLLTIGLTGKIDRLAKVLPKEVLQLTGTLNHLAANMNQVAKKRNGHEELTGRERTNLWIDAEAIKELAQEIKTYLK